MENIYIIGDIHGCYKTFMKALEKIPANANIVCVGDVINRGPDSKKVLDHIMNSENIDMVIGNHEGAVYSEDPKEIEQWLISGGKETLMSFDGTIPREYIDFLMTRKLYIPYPELKDEKGRMLVVSHARISNFYESLRSSFQKFKSNEGGEVVYSHNDPSTIDYQVVRGVDLNKVHSPRIFNVFGHTNVEHLLQLNPDFQKYNENGVLISRNEAWAAIDTGAGLPVCQKLTVLEFPSLNFFQEDVIDEVTWVCPSPFFSFNKDEE